MWYLFARPEISRKIVLENQILIIGVSEEIAFCYWLVLVVEEFEGVLVGELDYGVLERSNLLEHLIRNLRVQPHSTVLKLMERRIKSLIDTNKFLFQSLKLALILNLRLFQASDLIR